MYNINCVSEHRAKLLFPFIFIRNVLWIILWYHRFSNKRWIRNKKNTSNSFLVKKYEAKCQTKYSNWFLSFKTHIHCQIIKNPFTVKCCRCVWKSVNAQTITNLDYSLDPDILGHNDNICPSTYNIVCPSSLMDRGKNNCLQTFGCILYKDSF